MTANKESVVELRKRIKELEKQVKELEELLDNKIWYISELEKGTEYFF